MYCPSSSQFKIDQTWCREEYKKLGKMSYEEIEKKSRVQKRGRFSKQTSEEQLSLFDLI